MPNGPNPSPGPWDYHGPWGPPGYPPPVDPRRTFAKLAFLAGLVGLVLLGVWFRALPAWYQSLVVRIVVPILLVVVGTPWMRVLLRRARGPAQARPASPPALGVSWSGTGDWRPSPPAPTLPPAGAGELGPGEAGPSVERPQLELHRGAFARRRRSA